VLAKGSWQKGPKPYGAHLPVLELRLWLKPKKYYNEADQKRPHGAAQKLTKLYQADLDQPAINIYFVQQMEDKIFICYGLQPHKIMPVMLFLLKDGRKNALALRHPGIFVAMQTRPLERSSDTTLVHTKLPNKWAFFTLCVISKVSDLSTSPSQLRSNRILGLGVLLMLQSNDTAPRSPPPRW